MNNDPYNQGFSGQFGDRTDFDYRRGEQDRARLMDGRLGASGPAGGGGLSSAGPAAGGAGGGLGVALLVLLPILLAIAASVLSIGLSIAVMMVVLLNILPGHAPVSFGGAMLLGVMGALGCLIGIVLSVAAVMLLPQGGDGGLMWLTVPVSLELAALNGSAPLLADILGDGPGGRTIPVDLPGLLAAKALMWGPAVVLFARTYARNASFRPVPRRLLFPFGAALGALALALAFPVAGWIATTLMQGFRPFPERIAGVLPPEISLVIAPAVWALGVFLAGGAVTGLIHVLLAIAYRKPSSRPGLRKAALKWSSAYLLAGALTLLVMAFWPAADALVAWSYAAALPDDIAFAAAGGHDPAFRPPGLLDAMPGYLLAALPAMLMLAWMIHDSGLFRKNRRHDFLMAAIMAVWPMTIIGPLAALVATNQLVGMYGLAAP